MPLEVMHIIISVKPLTVVVLQYITVCIYICMHVCMYVIHTYICMCIYIYVHIICINHVRNHYFVKMRLRYNYNRYTYMHASTHIHAHHYWQIHKYLSVVTWRALMILLCLLQCIKVAWQMSCKVHTGLCHTLCNTYIFVCSTLWATDSHDILM